MKKTAYQSLALAFCLLFLPACAPISPSPSGVPNSGSPSDVPKATVRLAGMTGATTMGLAGLLSDNEDGVARNDYVFSLVSTPDEITAGLVKGDFDIAAVPCNLASVLYNNTQGGVTLLDVNTLGVLYIVETGEEIREVSDLRGRTLYATGRGATPEMTLNYLLRQNGIDPETDVVIEYKSEASEIAALLAAGEGIAMLPQPYVATVMDKNPNLRVALDVAAEWDKISDGESAVVTGVTVARTEFLQQNPEAVRIFLEEHKASVRFVSLFPQQAAELIAGYGIVPSAEVARDALPYCGITFLDGEAMRAVVSGYLAVLFEQNAKSVGGKLPDDEFYHRP